MLLSGALFALFMTGFWLYCLTDAILTPAAECRRMSKPTWIVIIAVTFIGGAVAWLIARQPDRDASGPVRPAGTAGTAWPAPRPEPSRPGASAGEYFRTRWWTAADDAVARHPAGRARAAETARAPKGPDDDPEFLRALDRAIRGSSEA